MLHTPLTLLRKAAPGSLTALDVVRHFARRNFPRTNKAIGAFERGTIKNPPERFVELYAEAIGVSVDVVHRAHRATRASIGRLRTASRRRISGMAKKLLHRVEYRE